MGTFDLFEIIIPCYRFDSLKLRDDVHQGNNLDVSATGRFY